LKLRKALILHKKSTFQLQAIEHKETRFVKLLEEGSDVVTRVKIAHNEHVETLEHVEKELIRRGVEYRTVARSELTERVQDVDMMISVGGDGTFLDASHYLLDIPILGVNSSESSSFGHFCAGDERNFGEILDQIENGTFKANNLTRLELILNGELLPDLVLNEVLVAHENPAATSRHRLLLRGKSEEQKSSGIWIGTASGSTGSLRSAGGTVLPITDKRFQFVVREPCIRPKEKWQLEKGILEPTEAFKIVSEMRTGSIFVDGSHLAHQFYLGDELLIRPSTSPLQAYISVDVNDIFI
jgi:NAD+ kinase